MFYTLSSLLRKYIAVLLLVIPVYASAGVIYVNVAANGSNDGSSWENAYQSLQTALQQAQTGDSLWVAKGTYHPSDNGDTSQSFVLGNNVTLLGGFSGIETASSQRDYDHNPTTLDGDIQQDNQKTHYSQHVVTMGDQSILDGVIVQHGYAPPMKPQGDKKNGNGKPTTHTSPTEIMQSNAQGSGAGILSFHHAGTVRNCIIRDNEAGKGAGAYNMTAPDPSMRSVKTQNNMANIPIFINDRFENNLAFMRGGAMENDMGATPVIINSRFTNNHCQAKGGAIYNDFGSSPIVINTLIDGNTAERAAAFGSDGSSKPVLVNVTISNNIADSLGAALYQGSYNVNLTDAYNVTTLIQSTLSNNQSLSHGPLMFNWGEDRYALYRTSTSKGLNNSSKSIPKQYQPLVAWADQIKKAKPSQIDVDMALITQYIQPLVKPDRSSNKQQSQFVDSSAKLTKTITVPSKVLYVNVTNTAKQQDGQSWNTAYADLQTAINQANKVGGAQLWIAQGTYTPPLPQSKPAEFATFQLQPNVVLYGGFKGDETQQAQRDFTSHVTLLSGKLIARNHEAHSYHVVTGSRPSLIDGVTISDGVANGDGFDAYGGGLFMLGYDETTLVKNTTFTNNTAYYGGAVYAFNNVMAYLDHDQFNHNRASMGGAIYLSFGSDAYIDNCSIVSNEAEYRGGGVVVNYGSNPTFNNTLFTNNTTNGVGGAMWVDDQASQFGSTTPTVTKCTFVHNAAQYQSSTISVVNKATIQLEDNIFKNGHPHVDIST